MIEILISILILVGSLFVLVSSIGFLRFRDIYSRMHAVTKATTAGVCLTLMASLLYFSSHGNGINGKTVVIILFLFITAPVGAHVISKAAYFTGVPLCRESVVDEFKEHIKKP
ncbi:MAG: multicomponent Na+:H+ antiporter subunit [Thermosediminibacterales bacterium]|nr:multicomponent Na+:H+ antiporter subunit [Thermosediminibacterales bacterium]MDK2836262.1 multicomponent Na+:H+ antiporter subunit [Thermosediminibacterales bacterium]